MSSFLLNCCLNFFFFSWNYFSINKKWNKKKIPQQNLLNISNKIGSIVAKQAVNQDADIYEYL